MSITGGLWARKGWPLALKNVHVTAAAGKQWISYQPFTGEGMRSSWTPDRTAIETLDGKIVKDRQNPRAAFDGHTVETPWDDLHLAYFSGYAMWNYLNTPFIFALSGFRTEEIEPWDENGEQRRRLKVDFPGSYRHALRRTGFPRRWRRPDLPGGLQRTCRRRRADGALPRRLQGFPGNQGGDAAAGAAPERRRHLNSRSGVRGDRNRRRPFLVTGPRLPEYQMTDTDEKQHVVTDRR